MWEWRSSSFNTAHHQQHIGIYYHRRLCPKTGWPINSTGYFTILSCVLGCPKSSAVFPIPSSIFPPGLVLCLLSFSLQCPAFVTCTEASYGTEVINGSSVDVSYPANTFSGKRNVIFTLCFWKSLNKVSSTCLALVCSTLCLAGWHLPFQDSWLCKWKRKTRKTMQCASFGLAMHKYKAGQNIFLLYLSSMKKANEQYSAFAGI